MPQAVTAECVAKKLPSLEKKKKKKKKKKTGQSKGLILLLKFGFVFTIQSETSCGKKEINSLCYILVKTLHSNSLLGR